MSTRTQTDDLHLLLAALPSPLQEALAALDTKDLLEIVMDLGRPAQARFPGRAVSLSSTPVGFDDLQQVVRSVGEFGADNRAGIEGTLHRISALRSRAGRIVGLTLRVGRTVLGTIDLIRDLAERGASVLLLGRPGIGKTTKLREMARVLADELSKRVIVIDTSNEIAGDGDVPHPAIGSARRMQVAHPQRQHAVMIEAVENHMPEVIIVDEIGTAEETMAARTIAERGVQLIGTAHGTRLENLVQNPTLCDLVGGVQTVTLGDDEARFRGTQKTINERKGPPAFDAVVEILDRDSVLIHADTAAAVDALLRGLEPGGEHRTQNQEPVAKAPRPVARPPAAETSATHDGRRGPLRIYAYALSRDLVERVIRSWHLPARTVAQPDRADIILALRSRAEDARLQGLLQVSSRPLHLVRKNTTAQIRHMLQQVFNLVHGMQNAEVNAAVEETELAIRQVLTDGQPVALSPRPAAVRQIQHRIVVDHDLIAQSEGCDPERHLVVHPV